MSCPSVSHVCSPGTASPVKLLLSRQMVKKYLEISGAPCAAIICRKHIAVVRGCVTSGLPNTGQGSPGTVGTGTAPLRVCGRAGAAAGAQRARRFYLTFTNRSCHPVLGVFRALTGKTSHPASSGTNWSFPVLEAFITKLLLSSFSYLIRAELCNLSLSQALMESAFFSYFCETGGK